MQEYQHKDSLVLKGGTGSVIKLCSPPETQEGCRGGRMDMPWWGKTAKCRAQGWMPTSSSFLLQLWHWPFPVMFSKPFSLLLSNLYLSTVYRLLHQNIRVWTALGSVVAHRSQRNVISARIWSMWYHLRMSSNEESNRGGSFMSSLCEELSCSSFLSYLFDLSLRIWRWWTLIF